MEGSEGHGSSHGSPLIELPDDQSGRATLDIRRRFELGELHPLVNPRDDEVEVHGPENSPLIQRHGPSTPCNISRSRYSETSDSPVKEKKRSFSVIANQGSVRKPQRKLEVLDMSPQDDVTTVPATPISGNPQPRPIDYNAYSTKKTIAEGLLDVALLLANASQFKVLIIQGPSYHFYGFVMTMLILSFILQIAVGVILLLLGRDNLNNMYHQRRLDKLNNWATALIFVILIINVFIGAFGLNTQMGG
ncbi:uncharacterized protein LOC117108572 [Anneissia japonica]|uniref:uncharacterized protein LOC117108572 n=1 Tax=Anneissia japonica TaxID=1529436 RepID=UPI0014258CB1|nr:uncharacterized protein LOC117108572 [Anneissia japonica]